LARVGRRGVKAGFYRILDVGGGLSRLGCAMPLVDPEAMISA
jgi:hypothetical protein